MTPDWRGSQTHFEPELSVFLFEVQLNYDAF